MQWMYTITPALPHILSQNPHSGHIHAQCTRKKESLEIFSNRIWKHLNAKQSVSLQWKCWGPICLHLSKRYKKEKKNNKERGLVSLDTAPPV
jgi:hypothetical protein